jgi:hypothetical protein
VKEFQDLYINRCYRNGPCLQGDPVPVSKGEAWDYYDRQSRSYIYLRCRLNQKHYAPSLLEIEEAMKFQRGLSDESFESPDLQLADTNGVWFTRSEDPELYRWSEDGDEAKTCTLCELVCEIRNDERYLSEDGSCPYDDAVPSPETIYSKVEDHDRPCQDFLHPLLLQDIKAINRRRARATKAKLWSYLKQKQWRDTLIQKGDRMADVWNRNYQPVTFYFNSFESIVLYLKNLPPHMKSNKGLRRRVRGNLELSPSYRENLEKGEWERRMLERVEEMCG